MVDLRPTRACSDSRPRRGRWTWQLPGALARTITSSGDGNKENGPGWSFRSLNMLGAGTNCSATSCATGSRTTGLRTVPRNVICA